MNAEPSLLMPTLVVFGSVLTMLACALLVIGGRRDRNFRRRVARASGRAVVSPRSGNGSNIRVAEPSGAFAGLERVALRLLPRPHVLRERLARTGRAIPLGGYLGASLGIGLVTLTAVGGWGIPWPLALSAAVGAGVGVPHLTVAMMIRQRSKRFVSLFPDAIDLIVRGLRSGLPVTEQLGAVGGEIADPVGAEFRRVANGVRFGQSLEEALWEAAHRLDITDFKFFVVSLAVQRETGGNLAETLQNLSDVLRRRRQMRLKVKAMASEATTSALIIGSLPFVMGLVLLVLNYEYISLLFTDPRGRLLIGAALGSQLIGAVVMAKMVRFEI